MKDLPNKSESPRKAFERAYVQDIQSAQNLLQKELTLIQTEQTLLEQRIHIMKSFVNDLPTYDPQYSMILTTIKMDQIEFDELSSRKEALLQKLENKT